MLLQAQGRAQRVAVDQAAHHHRLTNLGSEDYRNLLHMLQTEKPVFWDSEAGWLRTAHPQMHDAEPIGEQGG
ncbi:MAG: hypothetical protein M0Z99_34125 [Betaproteobacteria bacterium]|nr:hypothetical protein [Betaproteobacteria bacterium]